MTEKNLTAERDFVERNRDQLLKEYREKFLLVHAGEVLGSFDTYRHAADEGIRRFGLEGNFLVYQMASQKPLNFVSGAAL
jgi:hypothetical protein